MSHPSQFRVYFPKSGNCFYTTGFENGKPVVLVSLDKGEKFTEVFSKEIYRRFGEPVIQRATGYRDKNHKMIFAGDVVFWHKFNWLSVVVEKEAIASHVSDTKNAFWCQCDNGICSLVGSDLIAEVLFHSGMSEYEKIKQFFLSTKDVLIKYKIQTPN